MNGVMIEKYVNEIPTPLRNAFISLTTKPMATKIRLALLMAILEKEREWTELAEMFDMDISVLNHHLNELWDGGWIRKKPEYKNRHKVIYPYCMTEFGNNMFHGLTDALDKMIRIDSTKEVVE